MAFQYNSDRQLTRGGVMDLFFEAFNELAEAEKEEKAEKEARGEKEESTTNPPKLRLTQSQRKSQCMCNAGVCNEEVLWGENALGYSVYCFRHRYGGDMYSPADGVAVLKDKGRFGLDRKVYPYEGGSCCYEDGQWVSKMTVYKDGHWVRISEPYDSEEEERKRQQKRQERIRQREQESIHQERITQRIQQKRLQKERAMQHMELARVMEEV